MIFVFGRGTLTLKTLKTLKNTYAIWCRNLLLTHSTHTTRLKFYLSQTKTAIFLIEYSWITVYLKEGSRDLENSNRRFENLCFEFALKYSNLNSFEFKKGQ